MEIRQLRYFIAVADTLSFSRAAETVYLSQPSLSRQIADLEKEIGLPLFVRSTRSVTLTDAGRAFVPVAKEFISRWEKLAPELRNLVAPENRALTLVLGADRRALAGPERRIRVMEYLYSLRRKYPGILILLRVMEYQELMQNLLAKTLDCALVLDRELEPRVEIERTILGGEEMVLAFRSENAHAPEDFADVIMNRGLILVDREPQGLSHIIRILSDLRLEPHIRFCESIEDMTMTVETGESAMILPESAVKRLQNPHLQTLPLPSDHAKLQLSLLYTAAPRAPILTELQDGLRAVL